MFLLYCVSEIEREVPECGGAERSGVASGTSSGTGFNEISVNELLLYLQSLMRENTFSEN